MSPRARSRRKQGRRAPPRAQHVSLVWAKKWWFIAGGGLALVAMLTVLSIRLSGPETSGGIVPLPSEGVGTQGLLTSQLPDFPITLYQGREVLGSEEPRFASLLGGKPIVLNYWASNCAPCRVEMPEFEKVWRKYNDRLLIICLLYTSPSPRD